MTGKDGVAVDLNLYGSVEPLARRVLEAAHPKTGRSLACITGAIGAGVVGYKDAQVWANAKGSIWHIHGASSPVAFIYGEDQMEYMMQEDAAWQAIGMQPMPLGSGALVKHAAPTKSAFSRTTFTPQAQRQAT